VFLCDLILNKFESRQYSPAVSLIRNFVSRSVFRTDASFHLYFELSPKWVAWHGNRTRCLPLPAKFSKPFTSFELYSDDQKLGDSLRGVKGTSLKCVVHYDATEGEVILVKTGLSGVGVAGAQKNLDLELPGFDFERVRKAAHSAWQRNLSRIRIESSSEKHKEIFYTGLYHTMLAPTLFDDVDGQYRGMDGKVHQLPAGSHNYSTFSLWDTYRATHPMYTLILGDRVPDMVNCLIRMAEESPAGMPVWPLQAKETGCMTGYHSAAVIAEACVKGFEGIDFAKAYPLLRTRAMVDDYRGLSLYRKLGYIPCDREEESVSKTFEYIYDDWATAHVARAVNAPDDAQSLIERSKNYRNVFDKKTGFVCPRLENGEWATPFDPKAMGHSKVWRDFTESNAWQTTFAIQHDPKGYIEMFGGRAAFIEKLDQLFDQSSDLPADAPPDISGMVGQYAHGNEPCHHMPYLYMYAGAPYKTQQRVRSLLETMYNNQPDGMQGNEDCGQMSAWYVMSTLGFYSVDPVSGNYVMGTPLFDQAIVDVGGGKRLVIEARRTAATDQYVHSVTVNGKPYEKAWFKHVDLVRGGTITFHLGPEPSVFGSSPDASPPSLTA
jgi:predicted alpha-1,2-mannosidase